MGMALVVPEPPRVSRALPVLMPEHGISSVVGGLCRCGSGGPPI